MRSGRVTALLSLFAGLLCAVGAAAGLSLELSPADGGVAGFRLVGLPPADPLDLSPIVLHGFDEESRREVLTRLVELELGYHLPNRRRAPHRVVERRLTAEPVAEAGLLLIEPGATGPLPPIDGLAYIWDGAGSLPRWEALHPGVVDARLDPGSLEALEWAGGGATPFGEPPLWASGLCVDGPTLVPPGLVYRDRRGGPRREPFGEAATWDVVDVERGWLPAPALVPGAGGSLRLEAVSLGSRLRGDEPIVAVATTPGAVFVAFGGSSPRLARLSGATSLAWSLGLDGEPLSLIPLGPGLVALIVDDGSVYLVESGGRIRWSGRLSGGEPLCSAGVLEDDTVLVCLFADGMALIDPEDAGGQPVRLPAPAISPPLLHGETVIYGSPRGVEAVDLSGASRWTQATAGSVHLAPVALGGLVYVAVGDNRLYVLDPSRSAAPLVETLELGSPPASLQPLPGDGLAVGTLDGFLHFFRGGAEQGRLELGLTPRPGAALRHDELIIPCGPGELWSISLQATAFDPERPGYNEPTPRWSRSFPAIPIYQPVLFQPPPGHRATPAQLRQLAVYLLDGEGALWIISGG